MLLTYEPNDEAECERPQDEADMPQVMSTDELQTQEHEDHCVSDWAAKTKRPTICGQYFEMGFHEWKPWILHDISLKMF